MSKKSGSSDNEGGYETGYKKPPKATRFRPGQSGNPRGRPRGKKNLRTILEEVLYQRVTITENGKASKVAAIEALFKSTLMSAMKGDQRAMDRLLKQFALLNQQQGSATEEAESAGIATDTDIEVMKSFAAMLREADLPEEPNDDA